LLASQRAGAKRRAISLVSSDGSSSLGSWMRVSRAGLSPANGALGNANGAGTYAGWNMERPAGIFSDGSRRMMRGMFCRSAMLPRR
jgi:hypothetical protein